MDRRERRHLPLIKVVLEGEQRELNDPGQRLCRFLPGDYYLARSDTERDPQRVLGEAIALTPRGVRATIASSAPILGVRCSGGKTISKRPQSVSGSAVGRGSRVVFDSRSSKAGRVPSPAAMPLSCYSASSTGAPRDCAYLMKCSIATSGEIDRKNRT